MDWKGRNYPAFDAGLEEGMRFVLFVLGLLSLALDWLVGLIFWGLGWFIIGVGYAEMFWHTHIRHLVGLCIFLALVTPTYFALQAPHWNLLTLFLGTASLFSVYMTLKGLDLKAILKEEDDEN